jgi:hypothetical protein
MNKLLFVVAIGMAGVLSSCSSIRQIRPLEPGQSAVNVSLGGPIQKISGAYMPTPILSAGYNYGLKRTLDLEAGVGLLQAAFGIIHLDLGANWRPLVARGWIPGVIATPKVQLMTNFKPQSLLVYPEAILTAWWRPTKVLYPYVGIENWIEYHSKRFDGNDQTHHWLFAPYLGLSICKQHWQFQIESRWYTPNIDPILAGATDHFGVGEHGVLGAILGVGYLFGRSGDR